MPDLEHDIRASAPPEADLPLLDVDELRRRARRRQRTRTLGAASLATVVVVGGGIGAQMWSGAPDVRIDEPAGSDTGEDLEAHDPAADGLVVPDVVGLTELAAREELERAGLVVQAVQLITDDPAQAGVVVGQSPPAGVHAITDDPDTPVDETDVVVIQVGVTSPTAAEDNDPQATGWFTDDQREDDPRTSGWVAAWFAPEGAGPPNASARWWRHVADAPLTPSEEARRAVEVLDVDPPPGMLSAFGRGLTVHDVTYDGAEVTVDLDADSPGLHGHSTHGLILGGSQLIRMARHYFPEAETLCVAYDGTPTSIEARGPFFLHDADGCPIALE